MMSSVTGCDRAHHKNHPRGLLPKGENLMALYNETFIIYNYTPYELTLDKSLSGNLGNGNWPSSIAAGSASSPATATITQSGSTNVNPTAVYIVQSNPAINAILHFYCWGLDPLLHVNMSMSLSSPNFPIAIWENNSHSDQTRSSATGEALNLDTTDDGASAGTAKFVLGQTAIPS
jgi:hypothetical protein